jgi:hypothetical protein
MDDEFRAVARTPGRARHTVAAVASARRPAWWDPRRPRVGNRSWRVLRRTRVTRAVW